MKKHYNILILFILIPFLVFSNDETAISKQKNIKKVLQRSTASIFSKKNFSTANCVQLSTSPFFAATLILNLIQLYPLNLSKYDCHWCPYQSSS